MDWVGREVPCEGSKDVGHASIRDRLFQVEGMAGAKL